MAIKAILFDLDGVLCDCCDIHYKSLNRALKETCSFEIERSEHDLKFNGLPTKTKLTILAKQKRVLDNQIDKIYRLKQQYTELEIDKAALFSQAKCDMISHLWSRVKLGVVTNCSKNTAIKMLYKAILSTDKFNAIITNEDVRFPKPHPEGYIKALVNLRVYPEETLIFEDNENGIVAAHATGANVVKVDEVLDVTLEFVQRYL